MVQVFIIFKSKLSNLKGFKFLDVLLLHSIRLSLSICSQCLKSSELFMCMHTSMHAPQLSPLTPAKKTSDNSTAVMHTFFHSGCTGIDNSDIRHFIFPAAPTMSSFDRCTTSRLISLISPSLSIVCVLISDISWCSGRFSMKNCTYAAHSAPRWKTSALGRSQDYG